MNENDDQQVDGMDDFPSMAKWFFEAWLWQVLIFRLFNSHQSHITQYDFPESYYPVADSIFFFWSTLTLLVRHRSKNRLRQVVEPQDLCEMDGPILHLFGAPGAAKGLLTIHRSAMVMVEVDVLDCQIYQKVI